MSDEIELISDGAGLAVIGSPTAVEAFIASHGLESKDLGLQRLGSTVGKASSVAQAGAEIASQSGRWIKLTEQSAQALRKYPSMTGSSSAVKRAVLTDNGKTKGILEYIPGAKGVSPALVTGAAGLMAQLAMQQTMDEITDYLAKIDEKLDDVLRAQEDAVWADMIGVGFDIEDAMAIREHTGRVNDVTWSKVQAATSTISRTQAYALRQLDGYAEKLESKAAISDLAITATEVERKAQGWLVVLARSFQLRDAIAVLELDRVLDSSPEDLEAHRRGLMDAREKRLESITTCTRGLLARMGAAVDRANQKVLFNPSSSPAVVRANNYVAGVVGAFTESLGVESGGQDRESRQWSEAAADVRDKALDSATVVRDKALEVGAEGVDTALRAGSEALNVAKSITKKFGGWF